MIMIKFMIKVKVKNIKIFVLNSMSNEILVFNYGNKLKSTKRSKIVENQ